MKPNDPRITQSRLKEVLSYDHETGLFHWVNPHRGRCKVGDIAGNKTRGYIVICVDRERILAHRLAWFYVHGEWPNEIDHINGIRDDNRIANLRNTTASENAQNRCIGSGVSRLIGASWDTAERKWRATIKTAGRKKHLGYFDTQECAHSAYLAAKNKVHGYWAQEVGTLRIKGQSAVPDNTDTRDR